MLSLGAYALGVLELGIAVAGLGAAAYSLRARLLPDWTGAAARLVEVIAAIALATLIAELLGVVGLLREGLFLVACALAGCAAFALPTPEREGGARAHSGRTPAPSIAPYSGLVALAVVAGVFAHWGVETKQALDSGMGNFDSLWYHMPFATEIAQSGSTTGLHHTETVFLNWFYPQNSELLHALAILVTERDTLSLFLNLGWLAVALLAAWCVGRPYGRGPLTVTAAAILLECHTLVVREPGAAKNDVAAAALLLAAVAIVINAWEAQRGARGENEGGAARARRGLGLGLEPGWALAAAGLAAGLAAGTKVTVLAPVAALTVAAVALAPAGRRAAAAAWWGLPLLAGSAFWYLRNLFVAGNPIPQVRELGPLSLPGPERLQEGRPDFTVLDYATDTDVWTEYFTPELNDAFGVLWPLVLAAAVAGGLIALLRGPTPAVRWMGGVALFGMAAYLATPLSAAGADGAPEAFGINIRFAVPALLVGLSLLPLAPGLARPSRQWALLAALLAVLVVTNESYNVLRTGERVFGVLLALLLVVVPAALIEARRRGVGRGPVLAAAALLAVAVVAIGYPLQRDYLEDRYRDFDPGDNLDSAYRLAADWSDARVGLAGTTAGFLGYGFYGTDLSNHVRYLGREAPKGGFDAIPDCAGFRRAVNEAQIEYLVTAPFLNFIDPGRPISSPEAGWLRGEMAVRPVSRDGPVTVWEVRGMLDPSGCGPANAPLRYVPDQPQRNVD
jgi:hypothetical protein